MHLDTVVVKADGSAARIGFDWDICVAIGYAGRDQASVTAHVEELRALGVPAPSSVPSMYWVEPGRISSDSSLMVVGDECSGEVEFFAAYDSSGKMYFTIASDHTDRKLETVSVSKAKQCCSKIIGGVFWDFNDVRDHWDSLIIRSWVSKLDSEDFRLYQEASLGSLLSPAELLDLAEKDRKSLSLPGAVSFFSGTVPLKSEICYSGEFKMELEDPILKRYIRHSYKITELPDRN